jgi:preprotein translocase subunit SecG
MFAFIITLHVVVSVFLIFVILLQPGKGDGMAAFSGGGGGSSSTVFGGRGSVTFLSKVTTVCAIIFMITSLTLAWRSSHSDSVLRARRNLAAQDAKKTDTKPAVPTTGAVPAPVTGGAAIPAQGAAAPQGNQTPATPASPATKGPAAPAPAPKK